MAMPQEKLTQVSLSSRDPRFLTSKRKLEGSCVFEFKLVCRKIRKGSRVISAHLNIGRDGRDLTVTGLCTPAPEVMSICSSARLWPDSTWAWIGTGPIILPPKLQISRTQHICELWWWTRNLHRGSVTRPTKNTSDKNIRESRCRTRKGLSHRLTSLSFPPCQDILNVVRNWAKQENTVKSLCSRCACECCSGQRTPLKFGAPEDMLLFYQP